MSTEKLIYALRQVLRAEQEEQDARESYDGYDWGYHGHQWAEASRKAGEEFAAALNEAVDARVRAVLAASDAEREARVLLLTLKA